MTTQARITLPNLIGLDLRAKLLPPRRSLAQPNSASEIMALMTPIHFDLRRDHSQRLTATASRHRMKRAEFIRHLIATHPLMQETTVHG